MLSERLFLQSRGLGGASPRGLGRGCDVLLRIVVDIAKMCQQAIGLGFAVGSAATNDFMKKFHVSEALMAFVTVRARHVSPCSHQPSSQYRKCLDIAEPVPRRSSPSRLTPARCATGFMLKAPQHPGDALPVAAESLVS